MPIRDWAEIRKSLIGNYNPIIASHFGATPSAADNELIQLMTVKSNDSSLIAQSRIILFNQRFPTECYAAVPEWWQIRIEGKRPQMIFMFAQKLSENNFDSEKYPISIPHPIEKHYTECPLPDYQKGQYEGIVTLKDNSKIIVNAISQAEAEKVLTACKAIVIPEFLEGSLQKTALRSGAELLTVNVSCKGVDYFSTGLKKLKPDWTDTFK